MFNNLVALINPSYNIFITKNTATHISRGLLSGFLTTILAITSSNENMKICTFSRNFTYDQGGWCEWAELCTSAQGVSKAPYIYTWVYQFIMISAEDPEFMTKKGSHLQLQIVVTQSFFFQTIQHPKELRCQCGSLGYINFWTSYGTL